MYISSLSYTFITFHFQAHCVIHLIFNMDFSFLLVPLQDSFHVMIVCGIAVKADLPLILILLIYTDFSPLEFGKIQIFLLKIWQNTDFFRNAERFSLYFLKSYRFFL